MRNSKDWFARNQNNVTEWSEMFTCRRLFQSARKFVSRLNSLASRMLFLKTIHKYFYAICIFPLFIICIHYMYIRPGYRRNTLLAPAMSPSGEWTVLVTVSSGYQDMLSNAFSPCDWLRPLTTVKFILFLYLVYVTLSSATNITCNDNFNSEK
jgi:hypothetical protein